MNTQTDPESTIRKFLDELQSVPPRNPRVAAQARARFLAQAVSVSELHRHKGWQSIFRKERFAMNMLMSVLVIAGLFFGGGATVSAVQDDLPNQPLYVVKTWTEEIGLSLQADPEAKIDRLMDLAQIRVQEMSRLVDAGEPVPDRVRVRLEQHIRQTLQTCLALDEPTLEPTLLQIRERLRDQDRDLDRVEQHLQDQLQLQTQEQARLHIQEQAQILAQTRTTLRERLRLVEEGLLDHEMFRERVRSGFHFGQDAAVTPPGQNGYGQPTLMPGGPHPGTSSPEPGGPNPAPTGPTPQPGGPNPGGGGSDRDPGGPHPEPGSPNPGPGGPAPEPGGPNPEPGGPNPGGPNTDSGSKGPGGNGP